MGTSIAYTAPVRAGTLLCLLSLGLLACEEDPVHPSSLPGGLSLTHTSSGADGHFCQELLGHNDRTLQALSTATTCSDNPCDPSCRRFDEVGPFTNPVAASPTCDHELCELDTIGLDPTCDPCVAQICALAPDCCDQSVSDAWDQQCVTLVYTECAGTAPRVPACGFAVLAEREAYVVSDGLLDGDIGAGSSGITLNDGADVSGRLISSGPIDTGTHTNVGSVHTDYAGPGLAVIVGEHSTVRDHVYGEGDIEIRGHTTLGTASTPLEVRSDGDLTLSSGHAELYGDLFIGGGLLMEGATYEVWGDAHIAGDVAMTDGNKRIYGNLYGGGSLSMIGGSNDTWISGNAHAPTAININDHRIEGNAYTGAGSIGCAGCTIGQLFLNSTTAAPLPPHVPALPELPVLDDFRRDTSSACASAAAASDISGGDIVVTPGIYGRVSPGWLRQLRLVGGGTYVFESVEISWRDRLVFEGSGPWDIIVCDNNPAGTYSDPRTGITGDLPSFYVNGGPGAGMELAMGGSPAPGEVSIYSAETDPDTCIAFGHFEYTGLALAPDCNINAGFDSAGIANLWGETVWTADSVPLTSLGADACNRAAPFDSPDCAHPSPPAGAVCFSQPVPTTAGYEDCPVDLASATSAETLEIVEEYEAECPDDARVIWTWLFWDSSLEGAANITFEARTSRDGVFSGPTAHLATADSASTSEECGPFSSCAVDLTDSLWASMPFDQEPHLELRITLNPDGTDLATLSSWEVSYSCLTDR